MAVPQCNHIDEHHNRCPNDAQFRCTGLYCGNKVYCVEHSRMIDSTYICDNCLKETERTRKRIEKMSYETERAKREMDRIFFQEREQALQEAQRHSKIPTPASCLCFL
jgi:hypothetical protein